MHTASDVGVHNTGSKRQLYNKRNKPVAGPEIRTIAPVLEDVIRQGIGRE